MDAAKLQIHLLMENRFGQRSCEASHKWLRTNTGACHVSELTPQRAHRVLARLRTMDRPVRSQVWEQLSGTKPKERKQPIFVRHQSNTQYATVEGYSIREFTVPTFHTRTPLVHVAKVDGCPKLTYKLTKGGIDFAELLGLNRPNFYYEIQSNISKITWLLKRALSQDRYGFVLNKKHSFAEQKVLLQIWETVRK